jgi:hypothetical protein
METLDVNVAARRKRMLAKNSNGGSVKELATGTIEIVFDGGALRIASARYWEFMELMSNAARTFVRDGAID